MRVLTDYTAPTDKHLITGRVGVYIGNITLEDNTSLVIGTSDTTITYNTDNYVFVECSTGATYRGIKFILDGATIVGSNASPSYNDNVYMSDKTIKSLNEYLAVKSIDVISHYPDKGESLFKGVTLVAKQSNINRVNVTDVIGNIDTIKDTGGTAGRVSIIGAGEFQPFSALEGVDNLDIPYGFNEGAITLAGSVVSGTKEKPFVITSENTLL